MCPCRSSTGQGGCFSSFGRKIIHENHTGGSRHVRRARGGNDENNHHIQGKDALVARLIDLSQNGEAYSGELRAVSDEAIAEINSQITQEHIGRGLQINRLKSLRLWGLVVLVMFLLGSPFATNIKNVSGWPSEVIIGGSKILIMWMNACAMLLLGDFSAAFYKRATRK